jgi:hypothetical protein
LVAGNSIGGFTGASAVAYLEGSKNYSKVGLILMNSAGKIVDDIGTEFIFFMNNLSLV